MLIRLHYFTSSQNVVNIRLVKKNKHKTHGWSETCPIYWAISLVHMLTNNYEGNTQLYRKLSDNLRTFPASVPPVLYKANSSFYCYIYENLQSDFAI